MIYFTAHTFKCVCLCRRAMFRVLVMYNFGRALTKSVIIKIETEIEAGRENSINLDHEKFKYLLRSRQKNI